MEATTTINEMLEGNKIFVPTYQRSYSWETPLQDNNMSFKTHTDVFLQNLIDYNQSSATTPYYFGHFIFEEKEDRLFGIIDGQQRLTTIIVFLSVLFNKLSSYRYLTEAEIMLKENMIKRRGNYIFSTADCDNQMFKDYVIDQVKKNKNGFETESARRIINAFEFFTKSFADKDEKFLTTMLKTVSEARCTTYRVKNGSEAVQIFIFQNNRGIK